ncbi:MAG: hypothetical protein HQM03_20370 [Magnetococcales bacterium]|nr:hypothetical protein [Magnetococcales bacterium]
MPKRLKFQRNMVSLPEAVNWITYDRLEGTTAAHLEDFNRRSVESDRPEARWMRRTPEQLRETAENPARDDLLVALRDGDLRAMGRLSETKTQPWDTLNGPWGLHSGKHTEIPLEYWVGGQANIKTGRLTYVFGEYIDIQVPLFFLQTLWPAPSCETGTSTASMAGVDVGKPLPFAPTPYLELLNRTVEKFWSSGLPPTDKKDTIVQWLVEQEIGGEPLSRNLAETMATIIRPLEARAGGNRRW